MRVRTILVAAFSGMYLLDVAAMGLVHVSYWMLTAAYLGAVADIEIGGWLLSKVKAWMMKRKQRDVQVILEAVP